MESNIEPVARLPIMHEVEIFKKGQELVMIWTHSWEPMSGTIRVDVENMVPFADAVQEVARGQTANLAGMPDTEMVIDAENEEGEDLVIMQGNEPYGEEIHIPLEYVPLFVAKVREAANREKKA